MSSSGSRRKVAEAQVNENQKFGEKLDEVYG